MRKSPANNKLHLTAETAGELSRSARADNKYYHSIIKPGVQDAGMVCIRADEIYRPTEIMTDVHEFIAEATVIVAELTGRNPNVLYELGYSHAVGKSTVLIAQTIEDVPFDLRGFRCITYVSTRITSSTLSLKNLRKLASCN